MKIDNYPATKKKIFFAASRLFSQKCYADVGMREIANEAGVKVPTIYNHYVSKEAILDDLLQCYSDRLAASYDSVKDLDYDQDPIECFKKIIFTFDETEIDLMKQLMKILFSEQHRSTHAKKIIYDVMLRGGKEIDYNFLIHLKNRGLILCSENEIDSLAECISRVAITFAVQFVREEEFSKRPDYPKTMVNLLKIILNYSPKEVPVKDQE